MLIFERSRPGRINPSQAPAQPAGTAGIPQQFLRRARPLLPEVSELDAVRHYTRLAQQTYSIDTHFYPLGSCTMKYNPRACNAAAMMPQFLARHPLAHPETGQGFLACLYELQEILKSVTGMAAVSLAPMAGAQGEFAGIAMIRAWHASRGDALRTQVIIPDAAHGTNPATATMCGCIMREVRTDHDGRVDLEALRAAVGPRTAALMLTNPSTLGVFDTEISEIARIVHGAGGLMYYDGANINAVLGRVRPIDMGFDCVHLNLHKTFATPHGGGGPGAGPVGVAPLLAPFLPMPMVALENGTYTWRDERDCPRSIGRLSAFGGNMGVLLRAYVYARLVGGEGLRRISDYATLNSNYLEARLASAGFEIAYPKRRASHEFIVTLKRLKEQTGVTAWDVAKRLLDKGFHAPTMYFPLLVPECLLIEPTETESKDTLDAFAAAMADILAEAHAHPELVKSAPHTTPVRRLDEARAAREPDLVWRGPDAGSAR
jgi:glycine dehydrogenase subunit 2